MSRRPTARQIALRTLRQIEQREGFSNRILSEQLEKHPGLDPRDRGLVTTIVYGVLRHRARLDRLIDAVARDPRKVKGNPRMLLRIGAFELRELDRPLPIVSAEIVKASRAIDPRGGLKGLLVGILSAIDREGERLDAEASAAPPAQGLEQRWSVPAWLAARWVEQLGPEGALARARAVAEPPWVDLRVDLGRIDRDTALARLREELPRARIEAPEEHPQTLRVRGGGDLFHGPLHEEGLIAVQGLGSQQAALLLAPQPGERVLDACAGMGGKTVHLAELMERRGSIVAMDRDADRLEQLELQRERAGLDRPQLELRVLERDLGAVVDPAAIGGPFDAILLDAPCTGLGNLARHPELRWTSSAADVAECATVQRSLLDRALGLLAPGGRLVYAVCSLEPEEGPAQVSTLVDAGRVHCERQAAFTPEEHGCDGLFVALLRRVDPPV